ncbi:MAG: glycosyltransferase family 2 protein [Candidatus Paceibacterota bacterium]|jgi:glycosyltransferase involved in cell wall biosynthesis
MNTSIVIRTKNEAKNLRILFSILKEQTEKDFEMIIVDNESTDNTKELCEQYNVKLITITNREFSYPKAANLGASIAKGEYITFLSAHSFPPTKTWLSDGLKHFSDKSVCGVYGPTFFYNDSPLLEKITWSNGWLRWKFRFFIGPRRVRKGGVGVLGMTNAIIRKDLWNLRHFNEAYGAGGEDGEWAQYFFEKGYEVVWDPKFAVRHTHYIKTRKAMRKQFEEWEKMRSPLPFKKTDFDFRGDKEKFL